MAEDSSSASSAELPAPIKLADKFVEWHPDALDEDLMSVNRRKRRGPTMSLGAFLGDMTLVQASVAIRGELAARKLDVMDDDRDNWNVFLRTVMDYDRQTELARARWRAEGGPKPTDFAVDCMRRVLFPRPVKTKKGKKSALRSTATSADGGSSSLDAFAARTAADESTSTRSGAGGPPRKPAPATSVQSASTSTEDDADEDQPDPATSSEPIAGGDDDCVEVLWQGRAVRMPRAAVLAAPSVEATRAAKYVRTMVQAAVDVAAAVEPAPAVSADAASLAALQAVVSSALATSMFVVFCFVSLYLCLSASRILGWILERGTCPDRKHTTPYRRLRPWGATR